MTRSWIPGVAALLAALAAPARGQEADSVLTLSQAARRALATHPAVAGAASGAREARAAVGEARARWLPQITSSASLTRFEEPMIVFPLHGFDRPVSEIAFDRTLVQGNLSLSWTLFDGGLRGARIRGARAQAGARDAEQAAVEAALIARVARRYLDVVAARAVLEARDDGLRALTAEQTRVAQLVSEGEAAAVALMRVRAALAEAQAERAAARADLEVALRGLARNMDVPAVQPDAVRPVRSRDSVASRDSLLQALVARNPDLAQARRSADAARWGRRAAVAAWFPQLETTGALLGYGGAAEALTTEWQVGVRLSYPLFQGQRPRAVERAGALADAADARYRALRLDAEDALDAVLAARTSARERVTAVETAVAHLAEVARVELLSLETGTGTEAEYLRAEADLRRVRAELARARAALVMAHVELARLTGDLTLTWLDRTLETAP
jgi:outer membrane protein TolC